MSYLSTEFAEIHDQKLFFLYIHLQLCAIIESNLEKSEKKQTSEPDDLEVYRD